MSNSSRKSENHFHDVIHSLLWMTTGSVKTLISQRFFLRLMHIKSGRKQSTFRYISLLYDMLHNYNIIFFFVSVCRMQQNTTTCSKVREKHFSKCVKHKKNFQKIITLITTWHHPFYISSRAYETPFVCLLPCSMERLTP